MKLVATFFASLVIVLIIVGIYRMQRPDQWLVVSIITYVAIALTFEVVTRRK